MKCLCIILFALLYLTAAYGESFSSPNSGLQCKPAKSHIFKFENTHKPFELSLITNQEELQKYKEEEENTPLEGYIEFTHKGVKTKASALIKQRGQSRRESCEFKPFEVSFTQKVEAFEELGKKFNVKNLILSHTAEELLTGLKLTRQFYMNKNRFCYKNTIFTKSKIF